MKELMKQLSWPTVFAILFVVLLCVTLLLPTVIDDVVLALGFSGVIAAILALRDK